MTTLASQPTEVLRSAPRRAMASASIELLDDAANGQWDDYVERHPAANLYHLRAWKTVAEQAYGLRTRFLVARDARRALCGVLPLFRIPRPLSPYLTTGIFGAYGAVLADDDHTARDLLLTACGEVDRRDVEFLHVKHVGDLPLGAPLVREDHWVTAMLDLGRSVEGLWQGLSSNMRWSVRYAERVGLKVVRGPAELGAFYDVLSENMLRKGAPIYGRAFFDSLVGALGARADVVTLRYQGRTVSGALVVSFRGVTYVPFASSRPSAFRYRANNLLFWEIAKGAIAAGDHTLDFGSSMRDSTSLDFKRGWHPRIVPIGSYLYAREGMKPALLPTDSTVAQTTVKLWTRLSPRIAETLGPLACRWIA